MFFLECLHVLQSIKKYRGGIVVPAVRADLDGGVFADKFSFELDRHKACIC